jgi:putative Ca2+/H+ antiporter (TMEM165/GDT1 family)
MSWLEPVAVAFVTIALAELADKTQLVCISQACRYSVAPVLAGSALALVTLAAIGVVGGAALMLVLPRWALSTVAGALFIAFGLYVLWRRRAGAEKNKGEAEAGPAEGGVAAPPSDWRVFGSTYAMVAVAELGDKTQLGVIALTGEFANPWAIFVGASLAFVLVSSVGVLGGRFLSRYVESGKLELVAAALFLVLGAIFLVGVALSL